MSNASSIRFKESGRCYNPKARKPDIDDDPKNKENYFEKEKLQNAFDAFKAAQEKFENIYFKMSEEVLQYRSIEQTCSTFYK